MFIRRFFLILLTFLVALIFTILPLPVWANWLRPSWVALVLCFWILVSPQYIGIGIAWLTGLFLDVLNGTVLGEHALALTIMAYFIARSQRRLRHYPLWQQGIFVFIALLLYHLILFILQWSMGQTIKDWRFWLSPFIAMLLWPWVYTLLHQYQNRWQIV